MSIKYDVIVCGGGMSGAVAANAYHLDIHNEPDDARLEEKKKGLGLGFPKRYYHIPYRCLLPKGADNLLVSGRCISVTHEALASTRIGPCCMAIGQAAGITSALCSKGGDFTGGTQIECFVRCVVAK